MSTPADRIRRALGFCHRRFWSQKVKDAIKDAASALAELERERDRHAEVREIITSVVCGALNRAGINEVDNPGAAIDAIRNRAENAERERDELRAKLAAHCGSRRPVWVDGECSDAKRAETSLRPLYAAPPIPRVEQEPVAWVLFDDIFIAPKDMQDDPPNLECMKPLYAHPLALREPTEDECRRIANEFLILGGPDELAGRVMFNAVREVMTK